MTMATPAVSAPPAPSQPVVWYRGPEGDHAYPAGSGWMRSACREVRWTVRLEMVEGAVRPCQSCLAVLFPSIASRAIAPESPLETRAANGDR